jgi:hypothetical protein
MDCKIEASPRLDSFRTYSPPSLGAGDSSVHETAWPFRCLVPTTILVVKPDKEYKKIFEVLRPMGCNAYNCETRQGTM